MKIGGQIPWNAFPFCETFEISCLMGRVHTKDVVENLSKDQAFRLVHWLSFTPFLRKTSQESINLERKSYLDCSLDTLCMRGESGKETYRSQTLRSSKRWTHLKSTQKRQCEGSVWRLSVLKSDIHNRKWNGKTLWRRSRSQNIHLNPGSPRPSWRTRKSSRRIRRVFVNATSRLIVDGDRELLDTWTGFTRFNSIEWKTPDGYTLSWEKTDKTNYGQNCKNTCPMHPNVKRSKNGLS